MSVPHRLHSPFLPVTSSLHHGYVRAACGREEVKGIGTFEKVGRYDGEGSDLKSISTYFRGHKYPSKARRYLPYM